MCCLNTDISAYLDISPGLQLPLQSEATPMGPLSSLLALFILSEMYAYANKTSFKKWFSAIPQAVSGP